MKLVKEPLAYFRDISKTRVPVSMLKNAQHDEFKITLTVEYFTHELRNPDYVLFYSDPETALDDYRKILRLFKKLKG